MNRRQASILPFARQVLSYTVYKVKVQEVTSVDMPLRFVLFVYLMDHVYNLNVISASSSKSPPFSVLATVIIIFSYNQIICLHYSFVFQSIMLVFAFTTCEEGVSLSCCLDDRRQLKFQSQPLCSKANPYLIPMGMRHVDILWRNLNKWRGVPTWSRFSCKCMFVISFKLNFYHI